MYIVLYISDLMILLLIKYLCSLNIISLDYIYKSEKSVVGWLKTTSAFVSMRYQGFRNQEIN